MLVSNQYHINKITIIYESSECSGRLALAWWWRCVFLLSSSRIHPQQHHLPAAGGSVLRPRHDHRLRQLRELPDEAGDDVQWVARSLTANREANRSGKICVFTQITYKLWGLNSPKSKVHFGKNISHRSEISSAVLGRCALGSIWSLQQNNLCSSCLLLIILIISLIKDWNRF